MTLAPPARGHGHDGVVYCFREFCEPGVRAALLVNLKPGFVAYDIGANIGLWTLLMSRLVGSGGSVVAFEPVPATAARLRANLDLSRIDSARVEEVALGREPGTARMFVPTQCDRASLAPESRDDDAFDVPIARLDDYWHKAGAPVVNFLKIDAEGSEPRILAGAEHLIEKCRPTVACEVNPAKLGPLGHKADEIHEFFAAHDYQAFVWVDSQKAFRPSNETPQGDVLFRPLPDDQSRHRVSDPASTETAPRKKR
jgi:FkbM family methyltransferase